MLTGSDADGTLVAELVSSASAVREFLDRWRLPGDRASGVWEERLGEHVYGPLFAEAWGAALKQAGLTADEVDRLVVTGTHERAVRQALDASGVPAERRRGPMTGVLGNTGAADPLVLMADALDAAEPGDVLAVACLADGVDVLVLRATHALGAHRAEPSVAEQLDDALALGYARFLQWHDELLLEPPRRPRPDRVSAAAAARSEPWKFALVGSRDRSSGALHMPPARVSMSGGAIDEMEPVPMADATGTVTTFTIDRMTYSPSPPIVFAVVDFDHGGRFSCELTDVDPEALRVGDRVEMTLRRLFTEGGIHNYFWKARPVRPQAKE